jgi:hypothetical protein
MADGCLATFSIKHGSDYHAFRLKLHERILNREVASFSFLDCLEVAIQIFSKQHIHDTCVMISTV